MLELFQLAAHRPSEAHIEAVELKPTFAATLKYEKIWQLYDWLEWLTTVPTAPYCPTPAWSLLNFTLPEPSTSGLNFL